MIPKYVWYHNFWVSCSFDKPHPTGSVESLVISFCLRFCFPYFKQYALSCWISGLSSLKSTLICIHSSWMQTSKKPKQLGVWFVVDALGCLVVEKLDKQLVTDLVSSTLLHSLYKCLQRKFKVALIFFRLLFNLLCFSNYRYFEWLRFSQHIYVICYLVVSSTGSCGGFYRVAAWYNVSFAIWLVNTIMYP